MNQGGCTSRARLRHPSFFYHMCICKAVSLLLCNFYPKKIHADLAQKSVSTISHSFSSNFRKKTFSHLQAYVNKLGLVLGRLATNNEVKTTEAAVTLRFATSHFMTLNTIICNGGTHKEKVVTCQGCKKRSIQDLKSHFTNGVAKKGVWCLVTLTVKGMVHASQPAQMCRFITFFLFRGK